MRGGRLSEPPTRAALDPPPRSSDSEPLPSCQNCYASNERVLASAGALFGQPHRCAGCLILGGTLLKSPLICLGPVVQPREETSWIFYIRSVTSARPRPTIP